MAASENSQDAFLAKIKDICAEKGVSLDELTQKLSDLDVNDSFQTSDHVLEIDAPHIDLAVTIKQAEQSYNSEWPEFVYPRRWEASEDFMATHFYPKTEGMEEEWKSQMEFWTDCISHYAHQRLHNHRFSTRLSFTFDQIIQTYTRRKGTKPRCLEDVIIDLIIDSQMMPITHFLVEPSALNSIACVMLSLGRRLSGSRPTLQKDTHFVYLPVLKEFVVTFHQFALNWMRNNPKLKSPLLFENDFCEIIRSYFGTNSCEDKPVCERVLQNASRLIIKIVEKGGISQKVYKFSDADRSNVINVNEIDMHAAAQLDLNRQIDPCERKFEELKSEEIRVTQLVKGLIIVLHI